MSIVDDVLAKLATLTSKIQPRGASAAELASVNPVPDERELVVTTDTGAVKIGDGETPWNSLPSLVKPAAELAEDPAFTETFVGLDSRILAAQDHGVAGDGTTDDSTALNALLVTAAAAGKTVQLAPGSTVLCSSVIAPPDGTRLDLNGATIKADAAVSSTSFRVLTIAGKSDIKIWNGVIDGDKANFATATEHRHNIALLGSADVTLRDIRSINAKGDGIYLGAGVAPNPVVACSQITLDRVICDANHRQGMSIVTVDGLNAIASRFVNTAGTAPQSGVDIEPNLASEVVRGIVMTGCHFDGNTTAGLLISLLGEPTAVQEAGQYIGCTFNDNTYGIYTINPRALQVTGGEAADNSTYGFWSTYSVSREGIGQDVKLHGLRVERSGSRGLLVQQHFERMELIGVTVLDSTGIGIDITPSEPSEFATESNFIRIIGCVSGNSGSNTTQTHGLRTGSGLKRCVMVGNQYPNNTTAATSLSDESTSRLMLDPTSRRTVTGSRGGNAAVASLLTGLAQLGLITDSSSA